MADIAIFRINYKSDFILTLQSDAGWLTPFCIKFWTGAPSKAYYAYYDGMSYTHCTPVEGDPTKLLVQFDDHHLPIGDLKFQIGYHFTVADFPTSIEDEVINQASVIIEVDDAPAQVMLDFNGETAPEIEFSLPAYANEAQRIANEQARIAAEEQRIANEQARISAEETRQANEQQRINAEAERVSDFASLKTESEAATAAANIAATLANEKAQLADDKAALAQAAATLANAKAQLAADKAALAQAAATLANEKAALAQQKAEYAQEQGDAAKTEAETAHALNEEVRDDEEARDHAEQIRQQQEAARQQAEAQRVIDFNAQMQQQQTAYTEAEGARETAFNEAEHQRDAKVDEKVADITNLQAQVGYFVCDTAAATAAKTIAATGYVLTTGGNIRIKMTNANTADAVTLNINSTGAKALFYNGTQASSTNSWEAGEVVEVYYDGTKYQCDGRVVDNEPTAGSDNLVKSGGVYNELDKIKCVTGNIQQLPTQENVNAGYHYDFAGRLIETNNSYCYRLDDLSSFIGNKVFITIRNATTSNNRCILLMNNSNVIKASVSIGKIATSGNEFLFDAPVESGDYLLVSWNSSMPQPTLYFVNDTVLSIRNNLSFLQKNLHKISDDTSDLNSDMYGMSEVAVDLSNPNVGYYYNRSGNLIENSASWYKEVTIDSAYEQLKVKVPNTYSASEPRYILLKRSNTVIEAISIGNIVTREDETYTFDNSVSAGDTLLVSWSATYGQPAITLLDVKMSVKDAAINSYNIIFGSQKNIKFSLPTPYSTGYYYGSNGGLIEDANSVYIPEIILPAGSYGKYITIVIDPSTNKSDTRSYLLLDSGDNIKEKITNGNIATSYNYKYTFTQEIKKGDKLKCSWSNLRDEPEVWLLDIQEPLFKKIPRTCYISPNGSDYNDGTVNFPLKTINAALDLGANEILISEGEYSQVIDLTKCKTSKLSIKGETKKRIIFRCPDTCIADNGSEILVDGYTKVYKIENAPNPNYNLDGALWLFFDGLEDITTQISSEEIHPAQRGLFYRCECTTLVGIQAFMKGTMPLEDALNEIENCEENVYKWIYDKNTSTLYFNRAADTVTYPLYRAAAKDFFIPKVDLSLEMSNIEFRYAKCNLYYMNMAKIVNCACNYSYISTWSYSNSISIEFINCEACRAFHTNGDGFGAYMGDLSTFTRAKCCQVRLIDCWSHDNYDDGYSDHQYSETVIVGGLYEYNGKAGITPSYGSHCTCRDVYSRNNYAGFRYVGSANDAGNNGQLICYNCVSENNNRGGNRLGFGVSDGNQAIFINCMAINETTGFYVANRCRAKLINCKSLGCTTPLYKTSGSAIVIIQNGEAISD